jgi:hypothetical protein
MGRVFKEFLDGRGGKKYVCKCCLSDVALEKSTIWEGYMGSELPALLFSSTVNTHRDVKPRKEELSTGLYTLVDVFCRDCGVELGWEYIEASNQAQKYKEKTFLLQKEMLQLTTESNTVST